MALKGHLDRYKFKSDCAYSGHEAIQKVEQFPMCYKGHDNYRIILMDVEMPGITGIDATRALI